MHVFQVNQTAEQNIQYTLLPLQLSCESVKWDVRAWKQKSWTKLLDNYISWANNASGIEFEMIAFK